MVMNKTKTNKLCGLQSNGRSKPPIPHDFMAVLNFLTGAGMLFCLDDANRSLALACSDGLMHASLLFCLGTHQPKTYL
jgi:hypothetical protein